jgi:septum formation protein
MANWSSRLVLASASPRRSALLTQVGLEHTALPSDIDEAPHIGEAPESTARRLAIAKAEAIAEKLRAAGDEAFVLGADTIVVLGGEPLGKPANDAESARMIARLGGRTHHVVTGVAVVSVAASRTESDACTTAVRMRAIDEREARAYAATGEGRDKAGAYGVQGIAAGFVESIEGSYANVVGLPLVETLRLLVRIGALEVWP